MKTAISGAACANSFYLLHLFCFVPESGNFRMAPQKIMPSAYCNFHKKLAALQSATTKHVLTKSLQNN